MIASVSRNTRRAGGRNLPTTAITATANAMSVAVGIAQPRRASEPPAALITTKMRAGTTTPPIAAAIGRAARRGSRRRPATNSSFSSRPTTKKKIASRPSDAQAPTLSSRCSSGMPNVKSRTDSYQGAAGLLARTSAANVAASRSDPPRTSLRALERMPFHSACGAREKRAGEEFGDTENTSRERRGNGAEDQRPVRGVV